MPNGTWRNVPIAASRSSNFRRHTQCSKVLLMLNHPAESCLNSKNHALQRGSGAGWLPWLLLPLSRPRLCRLRLGPSRPRRSSKGSFNNRLLHQQAQPVDYQKIIDDLRSEIKQRDAAQAREIQQMRHDVALLDNYQRDC